MKSLPFFCRGEVIRGFGRGSKELGIPTANFPDSVVENLPTDISTGIYYGWACVGNGDVHKMVMSIGWNPYYKNTKKSMETHVIHTFKEDFYGEILKALISAINSDIEEAKEKLEQPEHLKLRDDNFFTSFPSSSSALPSSTASTEEKRREEKRREEKRREEKRREEKRREEKILVLTVILGSWCSPRSPDLCTADRSHHTEVVHFNIYVAFDLLPAQVAQARSHVVVSVDEHSSRYQGFRPLSAVLEMEMSWRARQRDKIRREKERR
ncbi:hypothetical protein INR49_015522 [Caranx melampygus]|nr:hypothetical protein INR49_015522 [Caranx melampygus]